MGGGQQQDGSEAAPGPISQPTVDRLSAAAAAATTPSPAAYILLRGDPAGAEADTPQDDEVHMRSISGFGALRSWCGVHAADLPVRVWWMVEWIN